MSDEPKRFRVVQGGSEPKPYRAKRRGEAELLTCWQCEADIGIATAMTIEVKQGRMVRDGKPEGGTRMVICAHCLSRGKTTVLLR